jgi:hypothetical protein
VRRRPPQQKGGRNCKESNIEAGSGESAQHHDDRREEFPPIPTMGRQITMQVRRCFPRAVLLVCPFTIGNPDSSLSMLLV